MKSKRFLAILQAFGVTFLWATSWVLIKVGLVDIPPLTFAGLRYMLAAVCLIAFSLFSGRYAELRGLKGRQWLSLALLGLLFYTLAQGAQFVSLAFLPAVTVNLILSFIALVVALFSALLLAEMPTLLQWTGLALSLAGAVVYFSPLQLVKEQAAGFAAALLCVLASAGGSILGRAVNRSAKISPLAVTTGSMGIGAPLLLLTGLLMQGMPMLSVLNWGIIAWLAVVNTAFAFTLWNMSQQVLSATESSIISNAMILLVPLLAVIFLNETINAKELMGMGLTLTGIILVQAASRRVNKHNL